jgi:peptide/nickel transport system permease protein
VFGTRTSLVISLTAIGLATSIALGMSLITAYYKGVVDVLTVITSDTIISVPAFLMVLLLSVVFQEANHPIAAVYDGGLLLALIFAFVYWPGLWRSIRGPSLQVAEQEWVDAAKSYGQSPFQTMRKHMTPYIAGYIMIYASLLLGGIIIATAALSFLGLGVNPPTPEWGRMVSEGRSYISTQSWHIATIPGVFIVFVVMGFNALGDGIRDAIDPESDVGSGDAATTGGGA